MILLKTKNAKTIIRKTKTAPLIKHKSIIWIEPAMYEPDTIENVLIQLGAFLGYVLGWCFFGWILVNLIVG